MTDEERQKLCEALRGRRSWPRALAKMMPDAADEIERLAAIAQSDAGPVRELAAQVCDDYARRFAVGRPYPQFKEIEVAFKEAAEQIRNLAASPRLDASAKLIEAAEIVDDWSRADRIRLALGELTASEMRIAQAVVGQLAESIRRAADRSDHD